MEYSVFHVMRNRIGTSVYTCSPLTQNYHRYRTCTSYYIVGSSERELCLFMITFIKPILFIVWGGGPLLKKRRYVGNQRRIHFFLVRIISSIIEIAITRYLCGFTKGESSNSAIRVGSTVPLIYVHRYSRSPLCSFLVSKINKEKLPFCLDNENDQEISIGWIYPVNKEEAAASIIPLLLTQKQDT